MVLYCHVDTSIRYPIGVGGHLYYMIERIIRNHHRVSQEGGFAGGWIPTNSMIWKQTPQVPIQPLIKLL